MVLQIFEKFRGLVSRPPVDPNAGWTSDATLQTVRREEQDWEFSRDLNELYAVLRVYHHPHRRGARRIPRAQPVRIDMLRSTSDEILKALEARKTHNLSPVKGMRLTIDGRVVGMHWVDTGRDTYFSFTTPDGRKELGRFSCGQKSSFMEVYAAITRAYPNIGTSFRPSMH